MVAIARIVKEERRRIKSRVRRFPPSEDLDYATEDAARRRKVSTTSSFKPPNINPNSIRTLNRPGSHTLRPVVSEATQKGLNLRALSVHYLKTGFLNEVRRAGFTSNSPVYVIENLKGPQGVIRRKGQDIKCPVDGRPEAAYVHCVEGEDNLGQVTHMLNYSWR